MVSSRIRAVGAAGIAGFALATLIGCSMFGTPPSADEGDRVDGAADAAAARFVACLTAEGQTAKILLDGMVGLLLPDGEAGPETGVTGGTAGGTTLTTIVRDDDGMWQVSTDAGSYPEDGGLRDAWLACEEEVPEFEQPEPPMTDGVEPIAPEEQMAAALAFAECARENGYADYPDPGSNGAMSVPADISEDGFRQLLEDCYDPGAKVGFMIQKETAESLDFDLMAVLGDFFAEHPEYAPNQGGGSVPPGGRR